MRLFSSQQEANELVWRKDVQYTSLCFTLLNKSFHGHAIQLQLHLFHTELLITVRGAAGGVGVCSFDIVCGQVRARSITALQWLLKKLWESN